MLAVFAVLAAAAVVAAPAARDGHRARLQVQMEVDRAAALSSADVRAIAKEVERIWAPAVDVLVSVDERPTIRIDTIRLALTTRTLPLADTIGLGWIEFVNGEPQPAITVSVAAARRLVAAGSWRGRPFSALPSAVSRTFLQRALGRAIAHEIGHYLLRSKTHEHRGLMRPTFTVDEIMDRSEALARLRQQDALLARRGTDD
jgi:hypothetical protein